MRQSWETMTSVSAGHIIQTPTQPVGSGRPQESRALPQSYRAPLQEGDGEEETRDEEEKKRKRNIYRNYVGANESIIELVSIIVWYFNLAV